MTRARNSANLASDGNLFVNISDDRTGIGSLSPTHKLHVAGTSFFDDDVLFRGANTGRNCSWDKSTRSLIFDGNNSVNGNYAKARFSASGSYSMDVYNNLNNFVEVAPSVALFVKTCDLQVLGSGSRGGTTYDGAVLRSREGVVELGHEIGNGGATGFKLATAAYGVNVTGTTDTDGLIVSGVATVTTMNVTGVLTYDDVTSVDSVGIVTARDHINIVTDGKKLQIGASQDLALYHDGTNSRIHNTSTGAIIIKNEAQDGDVIIEGNDGGTGVNLLTFDTSEAGRATFNGEVNINGTNRIRFYHNAGNGSFQSFIGQRFINNSFNMVIDNQQNNIFYQANQHVFRDKVGEGGEVHATMLTNGAVSLYHNGTVKFATTAYGIDVTGTTGTDGLTVSGATTCTGGAAFLNSISLNASTNNYLYFNDNLNFTRNGHGNEMTLDTSGRLFINGATGNNAFGGGDDLIIGNSSGNTRSGITIVSNSGQDGGLYFSDGTSVGNAYVVGQIVYEHDGDYMSFYTDVTERFRIGSSGQLGIGGATYGSSGQVLTSGGASAAPTWTTITGTTINSNTNNNLITGTGTANTLQGESRFTFDGSTATIGDQSSNTSTNLLVARGEAIGGGTGPVITLKHGPSGGTQRTHEIYSYIGDLRIVADSNENMEFHTGGSESFRITSGGEVNIGGNYTQTSAPLQVTTGANDYGYRLMTGTSVVMELLNNDSAGNCEMRGYYNNNSGTRGEGFRLESNGTTFFNPGGTTGLSINTSGQVAIGGNAKASKLTLVDNASQSGANDGTITDSIAMFYGGKKTVVNSQTTIDETIIHIKGQITDTGTNSTGNHITGKIAFSGRRATGAQSWIVNETNWNYSNQTAGSNLAFYTAQISSNGGTAPSEAIRIDPDGRLLVNTTSATISSAELFEVKSTGNGFSHFRNNSSTYAPIYIDNEATNNGSTLVPLITITDGGGNRAGFLMNNNSDFSISGQGSVSLATGGTVTNATERLIVEPNSGIGKVKIQGEQSGGTTYGLEIIGNQQTNAVSGADAGARFIAPVARRMYFEGRFNDDSDHFAWLSNPDYDTGNADTIIMKLEPKGRLTIPLQPSFYAVGCTGSSFDNGTMIGGSGHNIGNHYNSSTGVFTAPVAGRYLTGCGVLVQHGSGRLEGAIKKNNSTVLVNFNGTGSTYDGPTATIICELAANDNLRVTKVSGDAYNPGHPNHFFFAHLIG